MTAIPRLWVRLFIKIDAGYAHSLSPRKLTAKQSTLAWKLATFGYLRRLPVRGSWGERWVITAKGAHAWGMFSQSHFEYPNEKKAA